MRLSQGQHLFDRWLLAAGAWQGWSICPLLLSPEIEAVEPHAPADTLLRRAQQLREKLQLELSEAGTCLLIDLDPVMGITVAGELFAHGLAHPLLLLPRWPYRLAILEAAQPVWALSHFAPRQTSRPLGNVCIVIDAQRQAGEPARKRTPGQVDNRYQLTAHDFPSLNDLRAREIRRVVRLSYV